VARRLLAGGARVALAGRAGDRLRALGEELGAPVVELDARQPAEVERAATEAAAALGPLSGLANCVGSLLLKPAHLTSDAEWAEVLATNLTSAFGTVRAGARALDSGGGSIVLVSSVAARFGLANHEAIAAAKGGVQGLVLSAAATYAPRGIRVNAVAPGLVRTPLTSGLFASEPLSKANAAAHPLGRVGEPGDVAAAICWLLSPAQSWVTGQVLGVDGGMGSARPPLRR
jgi:NAD(P)-dependent dehydrogenase (short-subunit alcohol dehydrogenase family)